MNVGKHVKGLQGQIRQPSAIFSTDRIPQNRQEDRDSWSYIKLFQLWVLGTERILESRMFSKQWYVISR